MCQGENKVSSGLRKNCLLFPVGAHGNYISQCRKSSEFRDIQHFLNIHSNKLQNS